MSIEIEVRCAVCGREVDTDVPKVTRRVLAVEVEPCKTCIKDARDEGAAKAAAEG